MRIKPGYIVLTAAGVALGLQVDEEFVAIVEENFNDD